MKSVKYKIKELKTFFFYYNLDVFFMYSSISFILLHDVKNLAFTSPSFQNFLCIFVANIFGVIGIYTINKITDIEEDQKNEQDTSRLNKLHIYTLSLFLFIIAGILYNIPNKHLLNIYGYLLLMLGILYSYPKRYRLKKIFLIKNIIPSFCWYFSLSVLFFASTEVISFFYILKIMSPLFIMALLFEVIWDLPDHKGDSHTEIKTLPTVFGFNTTKYTLIFLILSYLFITNSLANKIFCLLLIIFLLIVNEKSKKLSYHYFLLTLTWVVWITYYIN